VHISFFNYIGSFKRICQFSCNIQVAKIDLSGNRVFVSYTYWDSRFDEWVDNIPHRFADLHTFTFAGINNGVLRTGQRVEVLDDHNKWLEAFIIDENESSVRSITHYILLNKFVSLFFMF
jgi:hypothetical protein